MRMNHAEWKTLRGEQVKPTKFPGVWMMRRGGFFVRARVKNPKTGKLVEVARKLPEGRDAAEALRILQQLVDQVRQPTQAQPKQHFATYAVSLLERKINKGRMQSASSRYTWRCTLQKHLLPAFGDLLIEQIRRADILAWQDQVAKRIAAGEISPNTANNWLTALVTILNAYYAEHELERNPTKGLDWFDTSTHHTYTEEEPNSMTDQDAKAFLAAVQRRFPQHFALVLTGIMLGLRPSHLFPLRWKGPSSDILWNTGQMLIRRSHTMGVTMERTKTGKSITIRLHPILLTVLREHVARIPEKITAQSDLLFPSHQDATELNPATLNYMFHRARKDAGITKKLTPRSLRRTFYNLCDLGGVDDTVARSIAGHASVHMANRYRTSQPTLQTEALGKMLDQVGFGGSSGGVSGGAPDSSEKEGTSDSVGGEP